MEGLIKEKKEYFYETKNYWVAWWGRKFDKKSGREIVNLGKDFLDLNTLKEIEKKR